MVVAAMTIGGGAPDTRSVRRSGLESRSAWLGCSAGSSEGSRLSTLALGTSAEAPDGGRGTGATLVRCDVVLLAVALPVFVVTGLPLLGYAAAAVAWLAQHVVLYLAERHAAQALERGDRTRAMGAIGFATLGRLWLVTGTILLVECSATVRPACSRRAVSRSSPRISPGWRFPPSGVAGTSAPEPTAADARRSSRRGTWPAG